MVFISWTRWTCINNWIPTPTKKQRTPGCLLELGYLLLVTIALHFRIRYEQSTIYCLLFIPFEVGDGWTDDATLYKPVANPSRLAESSQRHTDRPSWRILICTYLGNAWFTMYNTYMSIYAKTWPTLYHDWFVGWLTRQAGRLGVR